MLLREMVSNSIVLAVHPNYVVDAASAAASKHAKDPQTHGPNRLNILKKYTDRFKRFIDGKQRSGATIIITTMGEPYTLNHWYDEKAHWEKVDHIKMGMEQEQVYQIHQDLMDFINQLASYPKVYVVPEDEAGSSFRSGKLDHLLDKADELQVVGGNLTGCLRHTIKTIGRKSGGPIVNIIKELTFDDNPEFWSRK